MRLRRSLDWMLLTLSVGFFGWAMILVFGDIQPAARPIENKVFVALVGGVLPCLATFLIGLIARPVGSEDTGPASPGQALPTPPGSSPHSNPD